MVLAEGFESQLVKVTSTASSQATVLSSGDILQLSTGKADYPVYSVLDSHGAVVRCMHQWLRSLKAQAGLTISMGTVEQYGRTLSYLSRWIERTALYPNLSIDEQLVLLNRQDIVRWLDDMKTLGAESHSTLHSREACIRHFFDWLTTQEAGKVRDAENSPYGRDGTLRYVIARPNARSPKFISAEIVVELLNGMHNECERCMFHAQYDMGLRITEMVNLTAGDIPDDTMYNPAFEFIPLSAKRVKGRGGQTPEKNTLISRAVLKRIKRYHSSREYKLAPDWDIQDPNKPAFLTANQLQWSARNASKQFKAAVRRVGLNDDTSTHWMRHGTAYSVLCSDMGKDYQDRMLMVQQMLGQRHLKTTEIYTQIPPALLQKLTKTGKEINRLGEAELIRERTFLGPVQHNEKRGHRA
ncbi:tyrosine-type recombinase/integrase [Caballeronia novacaledonica]|uniref:Tyrosine-type recombinase/integrase n=2 Tax=Caballeronia novacaledonica TaxID=1544861 RepID=A0AA37IFU0_9BURK|nr:tyrosine-type recombinase/integrase [Caballeronia novacaledonica]GJH20198.1 tyrosine-type recombinase/integrase [Caballeronia novacaledonica]GJH28568.1 tyrosine-type recombinase/integrase [Caballeronia novacaledonica]